MSLLSLFSFSSAPAAGELPNIFPFPVKEADFVKADVTNIYMRILTDVVERTQGIPKDRENLLWDNCLASEFQDGLVTLLAKAMHDKSNLYVVFDPSLNLVRKANPTEQSQIEADYKKQGKSAVGIYITFKNYQRTDMVKIYSALEYCSVAALSKSMNLSKAIQLKLKDLRSSVGLIDSADVKAQAVKLATGLAGGKDVAIDAEDIIETAKPDLTATENAMEFIAQKRSFYLGMPASYITGEAPKGLGDSGEGDAKAVERGLKNYYFSIIKPALEAIFTIKTSFKSENFRQITSALETLKTFNLDSGELISLENKTKIVNSLFGLPDDAKGDPLPEVDPNAVVDPNKDPNLPDPGKKGAPNVPVKGEKP